MITPATFATAFVIARRMAGRNREGLAMTELSGYDLETLCEDGKFVLSRGRRDGETSRLVVVAPTSAQPAPGSIATSPGSRRRPASSRSESPGRFRQS
jgi:hypothetical protein